MSRSRWHILEVSLTRLLWLIAACMLPKYSDAQTYPDGLREVSERIGHSLESRGAQQIGTVLDLNGLDGSVTQLGKLIAQDVFDQLVSGAPSVTWIDPSRRDFIIHENQLAADRLMDPATQKRLGKLLGLSMIVTGTVTELGDSARIQLRAVEIETARVIGSASTTVQLPEALKRLNDRRAASAGSQTPGQLESDVLTLRANRVDLLSTGVNRNSVFAWSASVQIENTSGRDLWIIVTNLALGPCPYGAHGRRNSLSGVEYTHDLNPGLVTHAQRKPYYTPMPAGASVFVTVNSECRIENLPAFTSGRTNLVASIAVDFVDRLERRSFSIPEVAIDSNSAP
jgi:hypothetical protein